MTKKRGTSVFQIEGATAARRKLRKAGDDLHELRDIHREIAKEIAAASRAKAPVGAKGWLRRSVRGSGTKTKAEVSMGSKRVPYANAIHWGRSWWPNIATDETPSGRRPFPAPIQRRAFIFETAHEMEPQILSKYETYIKKVLDE